MRILIVDGDTASSAVLQRQLVRRGHSVRRASTAGEAMAICQDASFDLLVTELDLTDGSGASLARDVAAGCGARAVATYARSTAPTPGEREAVVATLHKPVSLDDLLQVIDHLYPDAPASTG
jgi:CheY-like chemotaxis protein